MNSNAKVDRAMTTEQFTQVVEAILDGKYSWACVLILRFAGYNPLHYIPYRTYNRLMKENNPATLSKRSKVDDPFDRFRSDLDSQRCSSEIADLNYLETGNERYSKIKGGNGSYYVLDLSFDPSNRS